jgi:hypothetical protein
MVEVGSEQQVQFTETNLFALGANRTPEIYLANPRHLHPLAI